MWTAIAQAVVAFVELLTTIVAGEEASLTNADNQRTARILAHEQFRSEHDRMTPLLVIFGAIVIVMMVFKYSVKKK